MLVVLLVLNVRRFDVLSCGFFVSLRLNALARLGLHGRTMQNATHRRANLLAIGVGVGKQTSARPQTMPKRDRMHSRVFAWAQNVQNEHGRIRKAP